MIIEVKKPKILRRLKDPSMIKSYGETFINDVIRFCDEMFRAVIVIIYGVGYYFFIRCFFLDLL